MFILHETAIVVQDRQRKIIDPKKIEELASSIAAVGLLQAPVVRQEGDKFILVAGERRLRAIRQLFAAGRPVKYSGQEMPLGELPVANLSDPTAIAVMQAELEENTIREDLTWQDRVQATAALHALRLAQNPAQTKLDTAQELAVAKDLSVEGSRKKVDRALLISQHMDKPEVVNAKSEKDALRAVTKSIDRTLLSAMRDQIKQTTMTLIAGDFCDVELPTNVNLIIADPPYGMSADSFGNAAKLHHDYADSPEQAWELIQRILSRGLIITAPQAHMFMFCDVDWFQFLREEAKKLGWEAQRTPIIWAKGESGHVLDKAGGFRRGYEMILMLSKGGKKLSRIVSDVIQIPATRDKDHAAQKPWELYHLLMSLTCLPGDRILDPTCGSGTVFRAAHAAKMYAWGVEKNEHYQAIAQSTIDRLFAPGAPASTVAPGSGSFATANDANAGVVSLSLDQF